jgi:sugar/nucleoside kinase (ribokinase family)
LKNRKNELLRILRGISKEIKVAVMPDFFLDRIITLEQTPSEFASTIANVAGRKGGSIDGVCQTDIRGGNAVNTASALAALGVKVTPIICTSKLGLQQVNFHLKPLGVDTSHVKVVDKASLTTAMELVVGQGKANVMFRDLGSLADFGPADLSEEDYEVIRSADYVCVFNWAGTRKHGTELAETVFREVQAGGKGITYFDTADPTPNQGRIPELMERVLKTRQVDVLSLNENEAITYAIFLKEKADEERKQMRLDELALESARMLAKRLPARIDLHTTAFSATFTKKGELVVPTFKIKALRATGAGDAWNAGNVFGCGNGLSDECRLTLANAVSACYLTDPEGAHPTREKLISFLSEHCP